MITENNVIGISQNENFIPKNKIIFKKKNNNKYDIKEIYKLNNNKIQIDYLNQFNDQVMSSFQFQPNSEILNQIFSNINNNNNNNSNSNNNNNTNNNNINNDINDISKSDISNSKNELINNINNFGSLDNMLSSWGDNDEKELVSLYKENKNSMYFYFSNMPSDTSLFLPSFFTLSPKKKTTYIQKQINKLKQKPKMNSLNSNLNKKNKKGNFFNNSSVSLGSNSQINIVDKNGNDYKKNQVNAF